MWWHTVCSVWSCQHVNTQHSMRSGCVPLTSTRNTLKWVSNESISDRVDLNADWTWTDNHYKEKASILEQWHSFYPGDKAAVWPFLSPTHRHRPIPGGRYVMLFNITWSWVYVKLFSTSTFLWVICIYIPFRDLLIQLLIVGQNRNKTTEIFRKVCKVKRKKEAALLTADQILLNLLHAWSNIHMSTVCYIFQS